MGDQEGTILDHTFNANFTDLSVVFKKQHCMQQVGVGGGGGEGGEEQDQGILCTHC